MPDGRTLVRSGPVVSGQSLYAGNSGTTARLLSGLVAGHAIDATIDGDDSLRLRPMDRVAGPLRRMGAEILTTPDGTLPMTIQGRGLSGVSHRLPIPSAQVKSAILIAGLFAKGETSIEESVPSRDHTERLLRAMSAPIRTEEGVITLKGPSSLKAVDVKVPGDISSAAFFAVAAVCLRHSEVCLPTTGVNPTRTGVFDILREMGAVIEQFNEEVFLEEPVADIIVKSGRPLRGVTITPELIPMIIDELPVIAVAATQAEGMTVVRGARELRYKESDRISAVVKNLSRLGADIEEFDDGFVVKGPCRLTGTEISSYSDHRIAMSMAVAAIIADGTTVIDRSEVADVSYPGFYTDLRRLTG
jgi:3-phosphoshikimate 1-carboxyvinyltransferase